MESEQRRNRKRFLRPPSSPLLLLSHYYSLRSLFLRCFYFFLFLFFLSFLFSIGSSTFRPILIVSRLSSLPSSSVSNSIQDSSGFVPLRVEDRVLFTDHVLLLVSNKELSLLYLHWDGGLDCVYHEFLHNSDKGVEKSSRVVLQPVLSVDEFDESRSIARCPLPLRNYSAVVNLQKRGRKMEDDGFSLVDSSVHSWEMLVYGAVLERDRVVMFVKGLNLRPDKVSDPTQFSCHFGWGNLERGNRFALRTKAVTAAQEIVQCLLPLSIQKYSEKAQGIRVTIDVTKSSPLHQFVPSVAKIFHSNSHEQKKNKKRFELCVCTMVWNQASFLREWIIYHAWLGIERWFIYDNNSNDSIKEVIDELEQGNYKVSRHVWPWIKTQEAGFSHCALKARDECKWVGFMDVDEFFYFPFPTHPRRVIGELGNPGKNSLQSLVKKISSRTTIAEIRMACHSFGPSGLSSPPSQGVTIGYTCRLQSPERHKSIVRPDALDDSLLNVVHHFRLRKGYRYLNLPQRIAVINHYKYQVWESFRAKFFRRVATYVADWQENQNEGSKDRAPGLGTEAIEPPNWPLQFCEVWDTGLKDLVMANLVDPASGFLPWERSLL